MSQVHILSPHEIPPSSLYAIQAGLRGRGSFCCGGHLLDLFKHYWPDFLFDTGALGIYVTQLQNRIDKDDPVSVLFSDYSVFLGSAPALRKTYVKQNFHITLARFRFDLAVPSINELPEAMSVSEAQEFADRLRNFAALLEIPHLRYRFSQSSILSCGVADDSRRYRSRYLTRHFARQ